MELDIKEKRKESFEEGFNKHMREVTPKEREDFLEDWKWATIVVKNKEVIEMMNGTDMLGKMPDDMKRNIAGRDMKIDLLKKKIKAKKIGHIVAGMGHG